MGNQLTKDFELVDAGASSAASTASTGATASTSASLKAAAMATLKQASSASSSSSRPTPIGSGGPAGLFDIYRARKKTTGQPASVFIFEKQRYFERSGKGMSKMEQERVCEVLRWEAEKLSRLRHPCVLEVVQSVDESRDSIAFATEPLIGSLANVLSCTTAAASASTASTTTPHDGDAFDLDELEIQKGLLQLFRALAFCHQDARMLHGNLSPTTVFINAKGDFKLGGFAFSRHLSIDEVVDYHYEYELPTAARPMLDYLAPENVMERKASCKSDVFALACVIHALFNRGQPALMRSRDNVATYRSLVERLYSVDLSRCPPALRDTLKRMLHRDPTIRPSIKEIQTSPYFDNLLVSTIKFMESMVEQMPAQKMAFFKGLPKILPQFPRRTLVAKILPMLLQELKDQQLIPLLLPCIFQIVEKLEPHEFVAKCLPSLKPLFAIREPAQCVVVLLSNMESILRKCTPSVVKDEIAPLLLALLDATTPAPVLQRALKIIPSICTLMDSATVKNALFPRIQALGSESTNLAVRVNVLVCFLAMLAVLDKFTITEKLLPTLRECRVRHHTVFMSLVAIYDELGRKYLDSNLIATEAIPELWRMAVDTVLSVEQFRKTMQTIHDLSDKVEQAHLKHLEEVRRLDEHQGTSKEVGTSLSSGAGGAGTAPDSQGSLEAFAALIGHSTNVAPPQLPVRGGASAMVDLMGGMDSMAVMSTTTTSTRIAQDKTTPSSTTQKQSIPTLAAPPFPSFGMTSQPLSSVNAPMSGMMTASSIMPMQTTNMNATMTGIMTPQSFAVRPSAPVQGVSLMKPMVPMTPTTRTNDSHVGTSSGNGWTVSGWDDLDPFAPKK